MISMSWIHDTPPPEHKERRERKRGKAGFGKGRVEWTKKDVPGLGERLHGRKRKKIINGVAEAQSTDGWELLTVTQHCAVCMPILAVHNQTNEGGTHSLLSLMG